MKGTQAVALAVAIACLGIQPAYALHKCTTKEGKVIYTEFDCEKDAKASGVPIYDSAGVDTKGKAPSGASVSSKGPRSTSTTTKPTSLPPMPTMGPPPQRSALEDHPNAGVRQNARYQREQENNARREKYDQDMKEWREKAAAAK